MQNAEDKEVKTGRQLVQDRLMSKYPDRTYEDDEALLHQVNDDYDAYDTEIADYKQREKALSDLFTADPRSAVFLTNWREGEDPDIAFIKRYGVEIKEIIDDPEKQAEVAAANKEFVERVAKEKELEDIYKDNLAKSMEMLDMMQEEEGLTDEEVDATMEFVINIVQDGVLGKFSPETFKMARKAMTHDADVATAAHEGEVRGRNEKIEETLRKNRQGDGTAVLGGKNNTQPQMQPKPKSIFDWANEAM